MVGRQIIPTTEDLRARFKVKDPPRRWWRNRADHGPRSSRGGDRTATTGLRCAAGRGGPRGLAGTPLLAGTDPPPRKPVLTLRDLMQDLQREREDR
jgi:hypothetical protein